MRTAAQHASSAYLASIMEAGLLVQEVLGTQDAVIPKVDINLPHFSTVIDAEELLNIEVLAGTNQRGLSRRVNEARYKELKQGVICVRDETRLASLNLRHAGDWLNVVPSNALGLQLKSREFRIATLYRLGMPVFQMEGPW